MLGNKMRVIAYILVIAGFGFNALIVLSSSEMAVARDARFMRQVQASGLPLDHAVVKVSQDINHDWVGLLWLVGISTIAMFAGALLLGSRGGNAAPPRPSA